MGPVTGARRVSRGLAWILVACLVGGLVSNFTFSQNWVTSLVLVPLTLLGWWGLPKLTPVIDRLTNRQVALLVGFGMAAMVLLQMAVLKWLPVTVYHDPLRVLDQATRMAVGHTSWKITYFWRYPQNVPIAYLLSRWLKLTMEMGMGVNRGVHLLSMLLLDGMVLLCIDTAWQVSKKKHLVLGILAFGVLTPFAYTYYLQVFYTDLPVMFVLLYLLRTLVLWRRRNWWQKGISGALLVLLAMLGQLTKANMIVIIPAMLLTALILWGRHRFKQSQLLVPMLLITFGVALSFPLSSTLDKAAHFTRQTDYEFPLTQWVAMGLNEKSNGVYNTKDAVANVKLETKAARNAHNLKVIKQRLAKQNVGLIKLWLAKLMVLTNAGNIFHWYNGGMQEAPRSYLKAAPVFTGLVAISYQLATCLLFGFVIKRLLATRMTLKSANGQVALLVILTALGYLAFHVLLWEVEERYGEVLVPLSWLLVSLLPVADDQPITPKQVGSVFALGTVAVLVGAMTNLGVNSSGQTVTVAAQRSQLSTQYGAKPVDLAPGKQISQVVKINGAASDVSVQIHAKSHVTVTLVELKTGDEYVFKRHADEYDYQGNVPAGTYQFVIKNQTAVDQDVDIVHVPHYRMAPYPMDDQGTVHWDTSLIYWFRDVRSAN
ncbi:hypothetical protein HCZ95_07160 [Limosilactobacillus fermentum]|nr:hypothetical protein AYI71_14875 [Limosilactobacillus oris]